LGEDIHNVVLPNTYKPQHTYQIDIRLKQLLFL
jgi:hypothetical protein